MVSPPPFQYPQRQRIWQTILPVVMLICCVLGSADGKAALTDVSLDLKVLVVSSGNANEDIGLDLIDDVLNEMGVPYDVLDSSRETLTAARLSTQQRGHYNGIILTNSELYVSGNGSGFTLQEWQILHAYERDFSVREAVLSGFPSTNASLDLDYGMTNIDFDINFSASWLSPAGGPEYFEYVNTKIPLEFKDGFAFFAQPRADGTGPMVQPLLVDRMDINRTLISLLNYPDGREVLLSTITNAWYFIHSNVLAYEFVNFATKGLFIGARQVYLSAHMDDVFLPNDLWNTATNATDETLQYRLSAADIVNTVNQAKQFQNQYPTIKQFDLDLAFNGNGVEITYQSTEKRMPADRAYFKSTELKPTKQQLSAMVMQFSLPSGDNATLESAKLNLWINTATKTSDSLLMGDNTMPQLAIPQLAMPKNIVIDTPIIDRANNARVCQITPSRLDNALKDLKLTENAISTMIDPSNCITFAITDQPNVTVDISSIVKAWTLGQKNNGLIVLATDNNVISFATLDDKDKTHVPQLALVVKTITNLDALTKSIVKYKNDFRFINHTFTHRTMNASNGVGYPESVFEIDENRKMWDILQLPKRVENDAVLVTGNHSGLLDFNNTEFDTSDDIPYPEGKNNEFMRAAQDLGVRFLASDSSQLNQATEAFVPGFDIILLPRWPANVYFNTTTANELTDEYNYVFYERFINAGQDPCMIPGAICAPRTFQEIMQAEADIALRHMLSYRMWSHFFHQSNMKNYDGMGNTLIYGWLQAVLNEYEKYMTLPITNPEYFDIGKKTENRLGHRDVAIKGVWDVTKNVVTLSAAKPVKKVLLTGIAGGQWYGGQRLIEIDLSTKPKEMVVDRALSQ